MYTLAQILIAVLATASATFFAMSYFGIDHRVLVQRFRDRNKTPTPELYDMLKHSKKTISIAGQTFISSDILAEAEWCQTRRDHIVTRISAIGGPALYGDTQQKLQRALVAWARWRYKGETLKQFVESCGLVSEGMALSQLHETTIHVNINADAAKKSLQDFTAASEKCAETIRKHFALPPEMLRPAASVGRSISEELHRHLFPGETYPHKCRARFDTGENFRGFCPRTPYQTFPFRTGLHVLRQYAEATQCGPECASHKKRLGAVHAHLRRMGRELTKWSVNWDKRPVGSSLTKADMAIRTIRDLRRRAERGRDLERELANTRAELATLKRNLTPPIKTPALGSEWTLRSAPESLKEGLKNAIGTKWRVSKVDGHRLPYHEQPVIIVTLDGEGDYETTSLNCNIDEFREHFN